MGADSVDIKGTVDPRFERVRAAFADNFARRGEYGAGVCMWHDGRVVVDLWAGTADRAQGTPWSEDTMAIVFSTTKGVVALCFLVLADRGAFSYDDRVADHWPEFAAAGKAEVTVRTLLNHRAGLAAVDQPITLDAIENRPDEVARILAEQAPRWTPDTDQGYHAVSYGLYAAELFRRIAGESLGSFLAREIAGPLGADVFIGLPEEHEARVATNYPATTAERLFKVIPKLLFHRGREGRVYRQVAFGGDAAGAFGNPAELGPRGIANFNQRRVHALELPWANAIASARGICRLYSTLAAGGSLDGVELVSPQAIAPLVSRQSWVERDRVLRKPLGWSQGFLKEETSLFSPNPASFGHPGAGGALGWCDPDARLAIGYVMNRMGHHIRSPRALALCRAAYRCVGS